ncbi:MAG: hypothetical protein LBN24_04980 [Mediterranea sp.]|jgi:hypothetical protein|nr:hypothetical protein [Mediterranea sp.]
MNDEISAYHDSREHWDVSLLSEQAAKDLDFDDLFLCLDHTTSCIGRQYLYHVLHYNQESPVSGQEELIGELQRDEGLRGQIVEILGKLRHADAYSIVSLFAEVMPFISSFEKRTISLSRYIPALLGIAFVLWGYKLLLLFLALSVVWNGVLHYRNKAKMQLYYFSVPSLFVMLRQVRRLLKIKSLGGIDRDIERIEMELRPLNKYFSSFRLGARLDNDYAILAYYLMEFVHIFFLNEAYSVVQTFRALHEKRVEVERLYCWVGLIDTLCSTAVLRTKLPYYSLPNFVGQSACLEAKGLYHPLIPHCVSNDIIVSGKSVLITGSNMSGKTSFIRTIGINVLSGYALNTCFAHSFSIKAGIQIHSIITVVDSLTDGKSYFLEEALQVKRLLTLPAEHAHLFLLDELFKGTNEQERRAISLAILHKLSRSGNIVFASTHDIELCHQLAGPFDCYYFKENFQQNTLDYDHRLRKGIYPSRIAIRLLECCDYPVEVLDEAKVLVDSDS